MTIEFNLIRFQDEIIEQIRTVKATAIGKHVRRSIGAVSRNMERKLVSIGYSEDQALDCWKQCREMADLLDLSEE